VLSAVGYVPLENIVGRAGLIFYSRSFSSGGGVRFERMGLIMR
jgi:signal peptidase I